MQQDLPFDVGARIAAPTGLASKRVALADKVELPCHDVICLRATGLLIINNREIVDVIAVLEMI